ncbi:MAG: GHKL domain-containing protein [Oscillospiraceae bacterium]
MSFGLPVAAMLQTFFSIAFLFILMPFRLPIKDLFIRLGGIMAVLCVSSGILIAHYGINFTSLYGYAIIALPLFVTVYIFSAAKGSRFIFVIMTILIFHRVISTVLMIIRVYSGGFTPLYFLMNFLLFGMLLYGGYRMRSDFHKIVFTYQHEFSYLSVMLMILLVLVWVFSPISDHTKVDNDILLISIMLYLTIIMLYLYIAISFRSFSKRLDAERNELSLSHQMQAAQEHINLIQATREKETLYRHDLRQHLILLGEFLDNSDIDALRHYLKQVRKDIDTDIPLYHCPNESANLIFTSFTIQAKRIGVNLDIDAQIPISLSISNTELSTLLSNALDNAITATAQVQDGRERTITLSAVMVDGKLLILIENPYIGVVHIEDDLPCSENPNGFGTKSMKAIVENHNGLSSFNAQDGIFTVRIVI